MAKLKKAREGTMRLGPASSLVFPSFTTIEPFAITLRFTNFAHGTGYTLVNKISKDKLSSTRRSHGFFEVLLSFGSH